MSAADDRDKIRLRIGDTDSPFFLTDSEIDDKIDEWPENWDLIAANCAEAIAAKFARGFDFTTDGQTFNRSQQINNYLTLARELRARGGVVATIPWERP